jgi:hypothetical protein
MIEDACERLFARARHPTFRRMVWDRGRARAEREAPLRTDLGQIHGGEALILLFRNQAVQQSMGVVLSGSGNGNLVPWSLNQPVSATLIRREHLPLHNTTPQPSFPQHQECLRSCLVYEMPHGHHQTALRAYLHVRPPGCMTRILPSADIKVLELIFSNCRTQASTSNC